MKKSFAVIISLFVVVIGSVICSAASQQVNIVLNGKAVSYNEQYGFPYVDENFRTMVPLRITMESAGFNVDYDTATSTAIVIAGRNRIEVPIGTNKVYVNGTLIINDTNAVANNGRTYLPIRVVLEAAGYTVQWDGSTNSVIAYSGNAPVAEQVDLFTYCKEFAIKKGTLNGDYCMYLQPATKYGGYDNEYFLISYWADSDMVEFCLHCPLSETQSHSFCLRMRGGYNGKYEYTSSKYFRDTGESFRFAMGYIDPSVFSTSYPINCEVYEGDTQGQNQFMENTRAGMCDLIYCLKNFVTVENMECDFSDFDFVNF